MGRKGAIGGLIGQARDAKASQRRKKMGPGSFLRGGKPGADFLAQFAQKQAQQQETARAAITDRLRGAGHGGGLFSRIFGGDRGRGAPRR